MPATSTALQGFKMLTAEHRVLSTALLILVQSLLARASGKQHQWRHSQTCWLPCKARRSVAEPVQIEVFPCNSVPPPPPPCR